MSRVPPCSISSFPSLSPCIPPSYPSSYQTPLPNSTNASYMPHLNASASAWHQLRRCSTHTYAILHTFFMLGFPRSRSVTTRIRRCLRHVADETNDLVYTPTNTNTNLNARSTVDDSPRTPDVSSSRCCSTTQRSASAC